MPVQTVLWDQIYLMKCLNINNVPSELYKRETLSGKVQLKSPKSVWVSCHGVWLFLLYQLLCGRGVLISMSRWRATFTSRWNTSEEDIIPIHEVDTIFVLTNVAQISNVIVSDFFLRLYQMTRCLFGSKVSDWFRFGWSTVARSNSSRFMILLCLILARPISATLTNFAKYLTKKLETELYSDLIWIPLVRMERPRGAAKFRQTTTGAQLRRKREERGQVSFTLHQITHPSHSCQPHVKPPFSCATFSDRPFFSCAIFAGPDGALGLQPEVLLAGPGPLPHKSEAQCWDQLSQISVNWVG